MLKRLCLSLLLFASCAVAHRGDITSTKPSTQQSIIPSADPGFNPLHWAIHHNRTEKVLQLLCRKTGSAYVYEKNEHGETPLQLAERTHPIIASVIKEHLIRKALATAHS